MQYTRLGRMGLMASRLCLGTMNFCPGFIAEQKSYDIMSAALEQGINFFERPMFVVTTILLMVWEEWRLWLAAGWRKNARVGENFRCNKGL